MSGLTQASIDLWMAEGCPPTTVMGNEVKYVHALDAWFYVNPNGQLGDRVTYDTERRPARACTLCKRHATSEGHDPCLGTLEGVSNACCGHGSAFYAYVVLEDGRVLRHGEALDLFALLGAGPISAAVRA